MNLPVRAYPDLIRGVAGPVKEFPRPENATLAEIIDLVPIENEALRPHLRAFLNGEMIDPDLYRRIRPKGTCYVTIALPVHGGGGNKNLFLMIAAVALAGASLFVGGFGVPFLGAAFGAGTIGANLVAAGLSLAASLLLQGLNAPSATLGENSDSRQIGVASAQNAFEPGSYLPRVMGTRKIAPPMVMPPYTEIDGDDTYVTTVFGLAGPHQIESLRIGNSSIEDADDVEYEIREGFSDDEELTLVERTIIEDSVSLRLSEFSLESNGFTLDADKSPNTPIWHNVETRDSPDEFKLTFVFDQGLGDTVNNARVMTALRIQFNLVDGETVYKLPEFLIEGRTPGKPLRLNLTVKWVAASDLPLTVTADAGGTSVNGWRRYYTRVPVSGGTERWSATSGTFFVPYLDWEDEQNYVLYLNREIDNFPQGRWLFQVMRGFTILSSEFDEANHWITGTQNDDDDFFDTATDGSDEEVAHDQDDFVDSLMLASVQNIWNEYPFDLSDQPTTLIAIRAKNRSLEQVNCIASGYTEDWNADASPQVWLADQVTDNPASWYREVLISDFNAEPVPEGLVDMENLQDWHEWCTEQGWALNAIVQGQPVTEILSLIAQAGMARPRYGATHGVVPDRPRDPVGLITQRNAGGFSFHKPFGRLPHALRVNLTDQDNEYEVRELTVYAEGYDATGSTGFREATRFESVTYPGITDEDQATFRAKLDLRFARFRSRLINFTMDIEHLEFTIGDRVYLETDILGQIGGSARIKSVEMSGSDVIALNLDSERDFTAADSGSPTERGIAIRQVNGTVLTKQVTSDDTDLKRVVFATPFAMPTSGGDDQIVAGCLVATGTLGSEARQVLIWDISPGPDLTAQIVAIDYAPERMYHPSSGRELSLVGTAADSGASSSALTLPSHASGDLLVAMFRQTDDVDRGLLGWEKLYTLELPNNERFYIFIRASDGTETEIAALGTCRRVVFALRGSGLIGGASLVDFDIDLGSATQPVRASLCEAPFAVIAASHSTTPPSLTLDGVDAVEATVSSGSSLHAVVNVVSGDDEFYTFVAQKSGFGTTMLSSFILLPEFLSDHLQLETGDYLLLETGDKLYLE